ncbi:MAG: type II toxin-antitoxin system HigB family toxin [Spirochaetaceae bacterium]|nr:type II toxin-antitoxin system HigB family toxin [Spirochaetaceae bacterium]
MPVISRKKLHDFGGKHSAVKQELDVWYLMITKNDYCNPNAIKIVFNSADILPGDRIVFNIKGNSYRIIVKIRYSTQTMFIRFIGTHAEYDKVDVEKI